MNLKIKNIFKILSTKLQSTKVQKTVKYLEHQTNSKSSN